MSTADAPDLAALRTHLFATVPEAARVLRSDPRSVRRAIERDELPAVRFGSVIRIPTAALLELAGLPLDSRSAEPATGPAPTSTSPATGSAGTHDVTGTPLSSNVRPINGL